jgi:ABC-2 type transport system ATP-binding protein
MAERPPASIRVEGLSHRYPGADVRALDGVSFRLEPGLRLGLLGPNGAGKSTLMRILCGYLPLQGRGRAEVAGFDVVQQSLRVRERVGYLPEQVPLYPELRVREHLAFRAALKRVARRERKREVERVAEATGITDRLTQPIGQLSRGYRQRVGIADALLGSPPLLVLDEPTVGLDPNQVLEIRAMLRELGGAQTLVFSSHILAEVEALCDHVVILSRGRVAADETLADALSAAHVEARFAAGESDVKAIVAAAWAALDIDDAPDPELLPHGEDAMHVRVTLPATSRGRADELLAALGRASVDRNIAPLALLPGRTRLEQRFAEVTGVTRDAEPS